MMQPKSCEELVDAANMGDAGAQYSLARLYEFGRGVSQNDGLAAEYYQKAANLGLARAQSRLGYLYENGRGVPLDNIVAAEWCRKAAEQDDVEAQTSLAYMYTEGRGVEQNDCLAAGWCEKAAEKGFPFAQLLLGILYESGSGVEKDDSKAADWYRKAAEQGNAGAQCSLGGMYEQGYGVTLDKKLAFEWYAKAAEQGDKMAINKISINQSLLFIRDRRYHEAFDVLERLEHETKDEADGKKVGNSDPTEEIHVGVDEEWNQHYVKAIILERENKLAQALKEARTSALIALERLGPEHVDFAASLNLLGELSAGQNRLELALCFIRRSLTIRFRKLGLWHSEVAECIHNIASLDSKLQPVEAQVNHLKLSALALRIRVKVFGKNHPAVALSLVRLGRSFRVLYDFPAALKSTRKAIMIYEETIGTDHIMTQIAKRALESIKKTEESINSTTRK